MQLGKRFLGCLRERKGPAAALYLHLHLLTAARARSRHTLPVGTARGVAGHTQPLLSVAAIAISSPPLGCKSFVFFFFFFLPAASAASEVPGGACFSWGGGHGAAALGCRDAHCRRCKAVACAAPGAATPALPNSLPAPPSQLAGAPVTDVGASLLPPAPGPSAPSWCWLLLSPGRCMWWRWGETPPLLVLPSSGSPRAVRGRAGRRLDWGVGCFTSPHLERERRARPDEVALVT